MKVGLVLEGGALRTIFSTGVFDALLEKNRDRLRGELRLQAAPAESGDPDPVCE